jgi:hypothetical protein
LTAFCKNRLELMFSMILHHSISGKNSFLA